MVSVSDICEDLGSFGEGLGNLSPRFGVGWTQARAEDHGATSSSQAVVNGVALQKHIADEIVNLGITLSAFKPKEVKAWV